LKRGSCSSSPPLEEGLGVVVFVFTIPPIPLFKGGDFCFPSFGGGARGGCICIYNPRTIRIVSTLTTITCNNSLIICSL
jgi:hypothetical protein